MPPPACLLEAAPARVSTLSLPRQRLFETSSARACPRIDDADAYDLFDEDPFGHNTFEAFEFEQSVRSMQGEMSRDDFELDGTASATPTPVRSQLSEIDGATCTSMASPLQQHSEQQPAAISSAPASARGRQQIINDLLEAARSID